MVGRRPVPPNGTRVAVPIPGAGPVILFDGVCVLCAGFVRFVVARDRACAYRFVAAQSPLGQALLVDLGLSTVDFESNVLIEDGRAHFKSEAFIRVASRLTWPWRWAGTLRVCPRPLRDAAYDIIAGNRYRLFGRRDSCLVPSPALAARFLD
ncbi:MAG: thiol-disulfide oxidoreductase DCC family protein [Rhodospirillales bacterium]|nr:MAG: thiol-disulfide oxidoreductase DCC family protein [Rhodospirillales bacterium]